MSCVCHGKKGEKVEGRAEPDAQCSTCALKHVEMAMEAWGEFLYEEEGKITRNKVLTVGSMTTETQGDREHLFYGRFRIRLFFP